jgi:hypothetical protein
MKKLVVYGIASYRPDQWARLREVSTDKDELEQTYEEWKAIVERRVRQLEDGGVCIGRVEIDVEELVAWCTSEGRPVDGAARAAYASLKLREQDLGSGGTSC